MILIPILKIQKKTINKKIFYIVLHKHKERTNTKSDSISRMYVILCGDFISATSRVRRLKFVNFSLRVELHFVILDNKISTSFET